MIPSPPAPESDEDRNVEEQEEEEEVKIVPQAISRNTSNTGRPQINAVRQVSNAVRRPKTEEEDFVVHSAPVDAAPRIPPSISIYMKLAMNHLVLNSTMNQEIPCSIELQGSEEGNGQRSGVDIICVIDVSGSMSGPKLELVQKTLLFMVKRLSDTDRVSIITFSDDAKTLSNLLVVNESGKEKLSKIIGSMRIEGGTEIILGLETSMVVLTNRKKINQVTSVLLLTDGVDNNVGTAMQRLEKLFVKYDKQIPTNYSIHTFGYGSDHQADLLNSVSQRKNGGFYFVESEASIPQVFSDCLGEMMSIIADSIQVELSTQPGTIPFSLTKVYSETGDTSFRMPPVLAGEKKEAMFLLSFPANPVPVPEGHREQPIKARVSYTLTLSKERVNQEVFLDISVVNEGVPNFTVVLDEDVMVNFYRAKAAEILREAAILGDRGDMENARNLISSGAEEVKTCVVASHPTVMKLKEDLDSAVPRFKNVSVYEHGGKADLKSKANNHYNKRGMYKNAMQKKLMVEAEEEI